MRRGPVAQPAELQAGRPQLLPLPAGESSLTTCNYMQCHGILMLANRLLDLLSLGLAGPDHTSPTSRRVIVLAQQRKRGKRLLCDGD